MSLVFRVKGLATHEPQEQLCSSTSYVKIFSLKIFSQRLNAGSLACKAQLFPSGVFSPHGLTRMSQVTYPYDYQGFSH